MTIPKTLHLVNPTLTILRDLGGNADVKQINLKLAEQFDLTEEELALPKSSGSPETKFGMRAGSARSLLQKIGLVEREGLRGWKFTVAGWVVESIDIAHAVKLVQQRNQHLQTAPHPSTTHPIKLQEIHEGDWAIELRSIFRPMHPRAFEKLVVLLLQCLGCDDVKLTSYTKDHGIDAIGVFLEHGQFRAPMMAQAKRYSGTVPSFEVRAFRGAANNKARYAFFITTGSFSHECRHEADQSSNVSMRLIDGNELILLLKKFNLGVINETIQTENVTIDIEWFAQLQD